MRCIFNFSMLCCLVVIQTSCAHDPNGLLKRSVRNKSFETRHIHKDKRPPVYNTKYIDIAKHNMQHGNYSIDNEDDELDELYSDEVEIPSKHYMLTYQQLARYNKLQEEIKRLKANQITVSQALKQSSNSDSVRKLQNENKKLQMELKKMSDILKTNSIKNSNMPSSRRNTSIDRVDSYQNNYCDKKREEYRRFQMNLKNQKQNNKKLGNNNIVHKIKSVINKTSPKMTNTNDMCTTVSSGEGEFCTIKPN